MMAINNSRNMWDCFHIQELVQFVVDKLVCMFDYFYQQRHQDKFVTVFFIERMPQYAFRQLYCHHQGFLLSEMLHRPILKLRHNSESIFVITTS
jgi:hypothetical protein